MAVCGEMAGDVLFTRLLLGFGLRQFSMHPAQLLRVKQEVLRSNVPVVTPLTHKMLKTDDPVKIHQLLKKLNG